MQLVAYSADWLFVRHHQRTQAAGRETAWDGLKIHEFDLSASLQVHDSQGPRAHHERATA
jgi:hypothetical protein